MQIYEKSITPAKFFAAKAKKTVVRRKMCQKSKRRFPAIWAGGGRVTISYDLAGGGLNEGTKDEGTNFVCGGLGRADFFGEVARIS